MKASSNSLREKPLRRLLIIVTILPAERALRQQSQFRHVDRIYREARRLALLLLILGVSQAVASWPKARQPGGVYIETEPSRALIEIPNAASLQGFHVKSLGRAPGPLSLSLEERQSFSLVVSAWGYRSRTVTFTPAELASGGAIVSLEPRMIGVITLLYVIRDYPFMVVAALVLLAFTLLRVRPAWLNQRRVAQLATEDRLQPGSELMGYRVEFEIGSGGMSRVYKARRLEQGATEEILALKVMRTQWHGDEAALAQFRNEIDIWRQLSHPNIVHLLDWGFSDGFFFLVTEWVEGQTLDLIESVTFAQAEEWALQVVSALAYAHGLGVTHRDIKPSNVILDQQGRARLLDFGVAVSQSQKPHSVAHQAGQGTLGYMPPEQFEGRAGPPADYYALGCTLYRMVAGQKPFSGDAIVQVLAKQGLSQYAPLQELRPDCPPPFEQLVEHLLRPDPEQRLSDPLQVELYVRDSSAWRTSAAER